MALSILDGNQTAVTLATTVSGGAHFPNHIIASGTVTANLDPNSSVISSQIEAGIGSYAADLANDPFPISGTVTIGSLPAISGTVTVGGFSGVSVGSGALLAGGIRFGNVVGLALDGGTGYLQVKVESAPAISGTVTANTFAVQGTAVTTSNFTSTTPSTVLANFNATREVLTIFNEGAGNLHICAGETCTTIAYQVRLSAGDYYEVPNHQTTITHSAVFATAGTARVTQIS